MSLIQVKYKFLKETIIFTYLASGSIIKEVNNAFENINKLNDFPFNVTNFSNGIDSNAKLIQKSIRGWLRRSEYLDLKKATNVLIFSKINFFNNQYRDKKFPFS